MEHYKIAEKVSKRIIDDGLSQAIFLKGALARQEEDSFLDLYVLVSDNNAELFLERRKIYLEAYRETMHLAFSSCNDYLAICVYENGLRMNLHTITKIPINKDDDILVIYDPLDLLKGIGEESSAFTPKEIGELLESFCLTAIEYSFFYRRQDFPYCFALANTLLKYYSNIMRISFDPEYAKQGLRDYYRSIDSQSKLSFSEIIKKLRVEDSLESVKRMFLGIDKFVVNLPILIAEYVNFDFYYYAKKLVMSIA
jgi:hypothetical protein